MLRHVGALVAIVALAGLSACASKISSDVTRYHKLERPSGETVKIVARDEERRGSLEFHEYAEMIGAELGAQGFRPAPEGGSSDLIVRVDYHVDDGQVVSGSYYPGYAYHSYFHHGFHHHGYPYFGHHYYYPRSYSYVVYTRALEMDIIDRETGEMLFEGKVESVGRSNRMNEIMPYLIEAMFTEFPGRHGETVRVVTEIPEDNSGRSY